MILTRKIITAIPVVVIALFFIPILAGIGGVLVSAFGYMPVLGFEQINLYAWKALFHTSELWTMLGLSLGSGVLATTVSVLLALGFVSSAWNSQYWNRAQKWLSPMMAAPHVALGFGLAFVLMPSGLLARLLAPLAGWSNPPLWQTTQDSYGLSLTLLLIMKETPFLIFMLMAAVSQLPVKQIMKVGGSLGYQPWMIWLKLLWPQMYPMIRLPVFTVLAYSISVVDIALVLGPTNPPMFSVQILQWLQNPDLNQRLVAAAGSLLLLVLVLLGISVFIIVEWMIRKYLRFWLVSGKRDHFSYVVLNGFRLSWRALVVLFSASSLVLLIWSFVWRWRFPSLWPDWSWKSWERAWPQLLDPLGNSLLIGCVAAIAGGVLAVILLELEKKQSRFIQSIMYLPLLLPQMTFLYGIQVLLLKLNAEGHWLTVTGFHLMFVLPYCYLTLSGPWKSYDQRQTTQALLLSGSRVRAFVLVKLRILWRPLMTSLALAFAVSNAQYLATLFAGAGRVETVTTEAVSLASGGSRRLTGVYALTQMLLPMIAYGVALIISHWTLRHGSISRRLNS